MSKKIVFPVLVAVCLLPVYFYSLSAITLKNKEAQQTGEFSYVLPSPLLKIASLEFDGLAADYLFLKALTFYGSTFERKERPRVKEAEWDLINDLLEVSTDLDPYFFDPYYFANANLTWEAHRPQETILLLAKGSYYRTWDWTVPYFMGFTEFYFLKNNPRAAEFLMEASKREDAPPFLITLAVRLALKGERTKIAIDFLGETLEKTKDMRTRKELETRLLALQRVFVIEQAVESFKSKNGRSPVHINDLLDQGIIRQIPEDPFGGKFFLDNEGEVRTTSDFRHMKQKN